jgi:D-ribose pyranose/furanose isomerase RbsD
MNAEIIACLDKEMRIERITVAERIENARQLRARAKVNTVDADEIDVSITKGRS